MVLLKSSVLVLGATSITLCYLMITEVRPVAAVCLWPWPAPPHAARLAS
jgi:hypothetical protein